MKSRLSCLLLMLVVVGCGQDELQLQTSNKPPQQPTTTYQELRTKLDADIAVMKERIEATETDAAKQELFDELNPIPGYIDQLIEFASSNGKSDDGLAAALEAVAKSSDSQKDRAMDCLIGNYAARLDYDEMITTWQGELPSNQIETWFGMLVEHAPDRLTKATAILGMAKYVDRISEFAAGFEKNPHLLAKLPQSQQDYLLQPRSEQQDAKLAESLEFVVANFNEDEFEDGMTYSEMAKQELFELQFLAVGKPAPEIIGKDLDGIEFKLSDYRGKVVMLDFWGHWCPPCRAMYDQERELVDKLGSAPFVLLGVNSDRKLDFARNAVRDEGLVWRHFWNGKDGTQGNIAGQWNIESWPTVYLIDGNGIIRHKNLLGKDLDLAIEQLLTETEDTKP